MEKTQSILDTDDGYENDYVEKKMETPQVLLDKYEIGDVLGRRITEIRSGTDFALKIINKSLISVHSTSKNEVDILKKVSHPHIISLKEMFESDTHLFVVMELVNGGEVFDEIIKRGAFSEKDAAELLRQVVSAVEYLHSQGIVHRDLKPENLLFSSSDANIVKIADFGLSKIVGETAILHTACGTPAYVAPEVLKCQGYGQEVDMWAVGVIMYILLCGFPPFHDDNLTSLYEQILTGTYSFPEEYWDNVSDSAKDLISHLLVVDPSQRYTAHEALKHPWLVGYNVNTTQNPRMIDSMRRYNGMRKFKTATYALIAKKRMNPKREKSIL